MAVEKAGHDRGRGVDWSGVHLTRGQDIELQRIVLCGGCTVPYIDWLLEEYGWWCSIRLRKSIHTVISNGDDKEAWAASIDFDSVQSQERLRELTSIKLD